MARLGIAIALLVCECQTPNPLQALFLGPSCPPQLGPLFLINPYDFKILLLQRA